MRKKILKNILVLTLLLNIFNFKQFLGGKTIEHPVMNDRVQLYCILENHN